MPQDDLTTLAEVAARHSRTIMARSGELPLASYIMTRNGVQMLVAGATDPLNQRMFAAITRMCGVKHGATATAVVMETWTVNPRTDEEIREFHEIKVRGGSYADHPSAVEKVVIITGDGLRQEVREYRIQRHHAQMAEMHLEQSARYEGDRQMPGLLTNLHVPAEERESGPFREAMQAMDEMGLLDGAVVRAGTARGRAN